METQALVILTLLSLCLSPKDPPKVEVQILEKQTVSEDRLRSYSLEEIAKLDKQIEKVSENRYNRDRLCSDRSNAYTELSLKKIDPIFRPCISKLTKMTKVPIVFPPIAPTPSYINDRKHYAYIDGYGIDVNKYRVVLTWNILERYQSDFSYFSGEKLTSKFPTLLSIFVRETQYQRDIMTSKNPEQYRTTLIAKSLVGLVNGKEGYYIPLTCGAHCHGSYSRILWENNGYVYHVGINSPGKEKVIELANSTINNQY